ncbi:Uncharacterised protein [Citrobacter koseri]|uniref:Oxidoreductase n=1 Tax=Citrobacter koseri TaxID=545 RepID=A0A2X2X1Z4_CITKO|nr:Uncharacterised protein [Citrobacter koseri]
MKQVRIGLIGTGYIGKAHAIAYAQAPTVFNLQGRLVREMVAEVTAGAGGGTGAGIRVSSFDPATGVSWWQTRISMWWISVRPNHLHKRDGAGGHSPR